MDRYTMLNLVVRQGAAGAYLLAIALTAIALLLLHQAPLWVVGPTAVFAGALGLFIARCAVELVVPVTDMQVPK